MAAIGAEAWLDDFYIFLELEYSKNLSFTGREANLKYIHDFIKLNDHRKTPFIIYSTGGVGKTQLVREFVYVYEIDFISVL
jgi:Cdc6-like AAA superfamily ATPase